MAGEFRNGQADQTFISEPRRGRVPAAKLLVFTVLGAIFGIFAAAATPLTMWIGLEVKGETQNFGDSLIWTTLGGAIASAAVFGALGVAIGAVSRNQLVAIVGALAWLIVFEPIVLQASTSVGRWLPGAAAQALRRIPEEGLLSICVKSYRFARHAVAADDATITHCTGRPTADRRRRTGLLRRGFHAQGASAVDRRRACPRTGDDNRVMVLYVAVGDSMSIDVYAGGPGRGAASLLHRNRDADFPDWAGRDLSGRGYDVLDLTYDGATSSGVLDRQLPRLDRRPHLVTVTMGGNDLMGAYGDAVAAEAVIRDVIERGEVILTGIAAAFDGPPRVVLTTVYDPSDGTGALPSGGLPPWPDGPGLVRALNAALAELAVRHGAVVADVHAHFLGHGVTAGDPGQPHPRPNNRELWYCGVIEPNAWGAHEIRRTWWRTISDAGWLS